jgi:hypothetical protein
MFGKSCLIIGGSVLLRDRSPYYKATLTKHPKVPLSYQNRSPYYKATLTKHPKVHLSYQNRSPYLIIGGSVLIREVDFSMFGKSCLIIGGSILIREVDFGMLGKSCLIIGGSVLQILLL